MLHRGQYETKQSRRSGLLVVKLSEGSQLPSGLLLSLVATFLCSWMSWLAGILVSGLVNMHSLAAGTGFSGC